ncbi:MAG: hypothetical protein AAGJ95_09450 [Cyanobacteria bacterium J06554_11]
MENATWTTDKAAFCDRGGFLKGSSMNRAIFSLSKEEFAELVNLCDPEQDYLICVDEEGCSINHGKVGTRGIRYEWSR